MEAEAEAEAEVTIDSTRAGFMQDNMIGMSAGTMRMDQITVQIDQGVVATEVANKIGVEAEALDAIIITTIQAESISRIIMVAIIKARHKTNVNNIIMNKADYLSQMVP